jgi:NTP pyrophosphatase (non-canonical NTP hydrolase)
MTDLNEEIRIWMREKNKELSTLTMNEYQERTADTAIYPGKGTPLGLIYCALKGAGEAGEFAEHVGKAMRDDGFAGPHEIRFTAEAESRIVENRPLTAERRLKLAHEIGDELWYCASKARELGYTLGEIARMNLEKLADRQKRNVLAGSGDSR